MLFNVVIIDIVSNCSLLAFGNTTDFCTLTLYSATLLNSFLSSNSFFVDSLGFSLHKIMFSANTDSFTFLPVWTHLMSFFCLNDLARTSTVLLLGRARVEYSLLAAGLEKASHLSH